MPSRSIELPALVREKRSWLDWAAVVVAGVAFPALQACHASFVIYALTFAGLGGVRASLRRFEWRERKGMLRAAESGVSVDGSLVLRRNAIVAAHLASVNGRPVVRLARRHFVDQVRAFGKGSYASLELVVDDETDARSVLNALRLDAKQAVARFDGTTRWLLVLQLAPLLLLFAMFGIASFVTFRGSLLALCVIAAAFLAPAVLWGLFGVGSVAVDIGADGVLLTYRPFWRRFVPYAAIERLRIEERALLLDLQDGGAIRVGFSDEPRPFGGGGTLDLRAAAQRIEEARARHVERGSSGAHLTTLLARGGRDVERWLGAVRRVRESVGGFRTPAIPDGELWRVVEDAAQSATARAGAAVALGAELDAEGCARLRVAADACAAPRLRVILDAVAEGEPVEGALAELEDTPADASEPARNRAGAPKIDLP